MNDMLHILILATLGGVFALIGGVMFLYIPGWSQILSRYSVPFAAGVLLTTALVGLLPEAVHMAGEEIFFWVLVAFLGSYLVEHFLVSLHHHDSDSHSHHHQSKGPVALIIAGDTIHNFIDGVAIAASYLINPGLGVITTVSTFLHEVPHEIGDFGILLKAGWQKKKILLVNAFSASTTLLGALLVVVYSPSAETLGVLMAIAAGMFLYLGSSDFLPHANDGISKNKALAALMVGTGIMLLVLNVVPHSHETSDDDHDENKVADGEEESGHENGNEFETEEIIEGNRILENWEIPEDGFERIEMHQSDENGMDEEEIRGYM